MPDATTLTFKSASEQRERFCLTDCQNSQDISKVAGHDGFSASDANEWVSHGEAKRRELERGVSLDCGNFIKKTHLPSLEQSASESCP